MCVCTSAFRASNLVLLTTATRGIGKVKVGDESHIPSADLRKIWFGPAPSGQVWEMGFCRGFIYQSSAQGIDSACCAKWQSGARQGSEVSVVRCYCLGHKKEREQEQGCTAMLQPQIIIVSIQCGDASHRTDSLEATYH